MCKAVEELVEKRVLEEKQKKKDLKKLKQNT